MPELPEVEICRLALAPLVVGCHIKRVLVSEPSYFFLTPPTQLQKRLEARTIISLERLGKYLLMGLDDQSRLLLHLGMTGQIFCSQAPGPTLLRGTAAAALDQDAQKAFKPDRHTHLQLHFKANSSPLYFRDPRKFGKVEWLPPGASSKRLNKLGPDALSISTSHLFEASRQRKINRKNFLLDQSVLAGVGNIYADEALFRAKLSPTKSASSLRRQDCEALREALMQVLNRSIATGGSSISDYLHVDGSKGSFQDERRVYGLDGFPCSNCKTVISRIILGGRSTHYCARCQKL